VCERGRERKTERETERERERKRERKRENDREEERVREEECVCVCKREGVTRISTRIHIHTYIKPHVNICI